MKTVIVQKTVDIVVEIEGKQATGRILGPTEVPLPGAKALRLQFSLLGETEPLLSPLTTSYTFGDQAPAYRYDWVVGLTPLETQNGWWNWLGSLRANRAIAVQLLVDTGDSGCSFSEIAAHLLTLEPSKDAASWLEKNSKLVGDTLRELATMTGPIPHGEAVGSMLKVSALMSNFVGSGEGGSKNWFLYRFLDEKRKCSAIEWNINQRVLEQYGPLLRGSVVLTFHGPQRPSNAVKLLLRPRLGFSHESEISYLPPSAELERETPVILELKPQVPVSTADKG